MPTTCPTTCSSRPGGSTISSAGTCGRGRNVAPASLPYSVAANESTWPRSTLRSSISARSRARNVAQTAGSAASTSRTTCDRPYSGRGMRWSTATGTPSTVRHRMPNATTCRSVAGPVARVA